MQNVVSISAVAAASLLVAQAALVLVRTPLCARRSVPLLLAAFFIMLTLHVLPPRGSAIHDLILIALLWSAGSFLIRASNRRLFGSWAGANISFVCTLVISRALGHGDSVAYMALRSFGITLLAAFPLGVLFEIWRKKRSLSALAAFIAGSLCLCLAAIEGVGGIESIGRGPFAAAPELLLSLCTGWLVFQEGYPERTAWRGSLPGLTGKEELTHSLYARLLAAENALVGQERTTTSGFLALAAAHEFKNILSLVRLAAHRGLAQKDPGEKDECLRLIVEHTNMARSSAIEVLERISSNGGEVACTLDAARDFTGTVRRAGAALRGEGIIIEADLGGGVTFRARRFDVEQIILNLIQNAAESYRRRPSEESRTIRIVARAEDECAIIEVRDSAGGVAESMRHRLFTPSLSGTGGSGLGLYLSRNLAMANGGALDYQPLVGGSSFMLALPAVAVEFAPPPPPPRT
ncbi:MAG: ATP-binding protein [Spirochaetia bacterium]